jgi:anti-sigma factor RsiW
MTTQSPQISAADEFDPGDVSERDARFIAYLEGDLSESEKQEFRAELDEDPELEQEFEDFAAVVDGVRGLPFQFAPDDFVDNVTSRIRTRSRGRFFDDSFLYSTRTPYEAIAVVMIAVMAAAWILMDMPRDRNMKDIEIEPRLDTPAQQAPESPGSAPAPSD